MRSFVRESGQVGTFWDLFIIGRCSIHVLGTLRFNLQEKVKANTKVVFIRGLRKK